jgi:hypothetical protein
MGKCDSQSKPLIADIDILSVQMTFGRSRFDMQGLEEPQYYPCQ